MTELAPNILVADRFRMVRLLGQGGMGAVWLAHHQSLDIPCAVKFIHGEAAKSADLRGRFEREAKSAAQLRSPNVVQILDSGVWEGMPYIAMEYLEGEDLSQRLRRLGRIDPRQLVSIVQQVARALTKAHAAGLVHRDLKPANIFLARDDDHEVAKVLDFGIAKVNANAIGGDSNTKTGSMLGTPFYMSPEQGQGTKLVDHRSDLWSLAVVVYQCVTGALPFESHALGDLLMKIIVHPIPVPSQVAPVPQGFDAWWFKAVQRDPTQRFQSAKEFADALALALGISVAQDFATSTSRAAIPIPTQVLGGGAAAAFNTPSPGTPYPGAIQAATAAPLVTTSNTAPKPKGNGALIGGVIAGVVAVALGVGFFVFRGSSSASTGAGAKGDESAKSAPSAAQAPSTITPPPPSAVASAEPPASATAPTPHVASAAPPAVKPPSGNYPAPKPAPGPGKAPPGKKSNTDFGI